MALSDSSIYVEILFKSWLKRMEGRSGPSLFCLYSLSELTGKANDWNKLTQAVIHIHSLARTRSHWDTVFQSFYLSLSHTQSVHVHFVRSNGNVSFQLFSSISFFGTALATSVIQYGHFDANIKDWDDSFTEMVSPVFPWSVMRAPRGGCSKQAFRLVFVLSPPSTHNCPATQHVAMTDETGFTWQWQTRLCSSCVNSRDSIFSVLSAARLRLIGVERVCTVLLLTQWRSAVQWSPQCWNDNLKKRSQVATKKWEKIWLSKYLGTWALLDCTEFFVSKLKYPTAQSCTLSSYKSNNTIKILLAITPNGVFSFVSDIWFETGLSVQFKKIKNNNWWVKSGLGNFLLSAAKEYSYRLLLNWILTLIWSCEASYYFIW